MTRAKPLPPDQRRAAIIAATKPLLLQYGSNFTTRQVAEAAEIAEGTIFRVFKDKDELVAALLMDVLDPRPACERIEQIDPNLDPVQRITAILEALQDRHRETLMLFRAMHATPDQLHAGKAHCQTDFAERIRTLNAAIIGALTPIADHLTCTRDQTCWLIRSLSLAASRPSFDEESALNPTQLATVLTKGLVK